MAGDHFRSRIIAFSKIVLPLASLAILSSLFLLSRSNDVANGIRALDGDLAEIARKERITAPRFAGLTPSGVAIQVAAAEASPRRTGGPAFDADDLTAHIETPDGATIDIEALKGSIDSLAMAARLTGGVILSTSYGYVAQTFGFDFALDRLDIQSQGEITATGPLGEIRAGMLHLKLDEDADAESPPGYLLVFKDGVKLLYQP
ncbi:MAG: hypothetical protein KDA67_13620 [Rhodobacteraceae bacterium]|nr:hypothetical protein [Paracoccaceae bacterium]